MSYCQCSQHAPCVTCAIFVACSDVGFALSESTGLNDVSGYMHIGMCETEVSPLCPSGWAFYSDADGSEGAPSCVWVSATPASWIDASTSCPSGGHLLTVKSYVAAGGLLGFAMSLVPDLMYVHIGCSQSISATQSGSGWTWVDGTDASNLACGSRLGCGLWSTLEPE